LQASDGTSGPSPPEFPAGAGARSVVLGDLNADGKLDAITLNDASVSVLLGLGGGSFAGKVDYPLGGRPPAVVLGDVNGDGKPDIVSNLPHGVLLGKGDGTFAAKSDDGKGIGGTALALGDLNGDGKLDVATVSYSGYRIENGTVSVRLGNGDGSFAAATDYPVGLNPDGVALGDLNGDGMLDLVVANLGLDGGWSLSVLLGTGDGRFGAASDITSGSSPTWVELAELNGDGRLDIIDSSLNVSPGNGDGTFGGLQSPLPGLASDSAAFADLDGDGKLDFVGAYDRAATLDVAFGRGDGTFDAHVGYTIDAAGIALGDLNGDGLLDVVATKPGASAVFALITSCR
jgi:FG-GAP-like repeat/FG-GAP repeat